MKRFHVHVSVNSLEESIGFYSSLFGTAPSVHKPDYAKWMLEDPRVNFAISQQKCGSKIGINHLGLQVDSGEELAALDAQFAAAGLAGVKEEGANCCYAKSDKHWLQDPQGIAWEQFHSLGSVPVFGSDAPEMVGGACTPTMLPAAAATPKASACGPKAAPGCCG